MAAEGRPRMYAAASNMLNNAFGLLSRRSLERQTPRMKLVPACFGKMHIGHSVPVSF
jgi:hypothetical protein